MKIKMLIISLMLFFSCASHTEIKTEEQIRYEKYACEKNKRLAEESGSGIIIECD
jgi:hypothetical protein